MAHQRKLIRQAVVALLINANTAAGARVKGTRVEPHKKSQLPAISVYTLSDPVDVDLSSSSEPIETTHNLQLEITGWVAHSDTVPADDAMDDLAEQIEAAMASDYYITNTAAAQQKTGTQMQIVEDDGRSDPLVGIITITYDVTYRTSPAVVGGNIQDFLRVDVTYAVANSVTDTVPGSDAFTVQEITP